MRLQGVFLAALALRVLSPGPVWAGESADGRFGLTEDGRFGLTEDDRSGLTEDDRSGLTEDDRSGLTEDDRSGLTFGAIGERAVERSFELRAQGRLLELRRTAWRLGFRAWFPAVSLGASEDERLSAAAPDSFARSWKLSLSQLLWDGGRLLANRRIESAAIDLDRMKLLREARGIAEGAVQAARAILARRAELAVLRDEATFLREQKDFLAIEFASGLVAEGELREAELSCEEARIAAELSSAELLQGERDLARNLGFEDLPPITGKLDPDVSATPAPVEALVALALKGNPDILEAEFDVKKAEAALRLARSAWIPTLSLEASGELGGSRYPLTEASWSAGIRVGFNTPFFTSSSSLSTGGETPATRKAACSTSLSVLDDPAAPVASGEAKARLELSLEKRDLALKAIPLRIGEAVERQKLAERKLSLAREGLAAARTRLELGRLALGLGKLTRTDLIEQRLELGKRELAVIQAVSELLSRERELENLAGLYPGELALAGGMHEPEK